MSATVETPARPGTQGVAFAAKGKNLRGDEQRLVFLETGAGHFHVRRDEIRAAELKGDGFDHACALRFRAALGKPLRRRGVELAGIDDLSGLQQLQVDPFDLEERRAVIDHGHVLQEEAVDVALAFERIGVDSRRGTETNLHVRRGAGVRPGGELGKRNREEGDAKRLHERWDAEGAGFGFNNALRP
ncbi:MAG: hypothetical protein H0U88_01285 [Chthoniobacterales bacterium]|nr:hypothetical protein [Chthoniobacterales bacterium]